ncbi:MAG: thermonuclease family protein [Mycobacterium sp.]
MIRTVFVAAVVAVAGIGFLPPATSDAQGVDTTAEVLRVVDGDTIDIRDDNRGRLRVRVLGIDTPETKKPGHTVGCWGPEATQFATTTLLGQRVALQLDPTQDRTDSYGRTLAYLVRADGWDYSVEAARAGTARSYVYDGVPVSRYNTIQAAESEARDAGRGLWGPPCYGETESTATTQPQSASPAAPPTSESAPPLGLYEPPLPSSSAYYENCTAARRAGAAPLLAGQQGYRSGLDGDGDGVACE